MAKDPYPCFYVVFSDDKEQVHVFDENETCSPYASGDYTGHCGGCDNCCLMQARHSGFTVERLVQFEGESILDAAERQVFQSEFRHDVVGALGQDASDLSPLAQSILYKLWRSALHRKPSPAFALEEAPQAPTSHEDRVGELVGAQGQEILLEYTRRLVDVMFPDTSKDEKEEHIVSFVESMSREQIHDVGRRFGVLRIS